jgi:hypothetical protein
MAMPECQVWSEALVETACQYAKSSHEFSSWICGNRRRLFDEYLCILLIFNGHSVAALARRVANEISTD